MDNGNWAKQNLGLNVYTYTWIAFYSGNVTEI